MPDSSQPGARGTSIFDEGLVRDPKGALPLALTLEAILFLRSAITDLSGRIEAMERRHESAQSEGGAIP